MSKGSSRTKAEWDALYARIADITKKDPELTRAAIALRCGVHEATVREAQKAAGLYERRGASGSTPKERAS